MQADLRKVYESSARRHNYLADLLQAKRLKSALDGITLVRPGLGSWISRGNMVNFQSDHEYDYCEPVSTALGHRVEALFGPKTAKPFLRLCCYQVSATGPGNSITRTGRRFAEQQFEIDFLASAGK